MTWSSVATWRNLVKLMIGQMGVGNFDTLGNCLPRWPYWRGFGGNLWGAGKVVIIIAARPGQYHSFFFTAMLIASTEFTQRQKGLRWFISPVGVLPSFASSMRITDKSISIFIPLFFFHRNTKTITKKCERKPNLKLFGQLFHPVVPSNLFQLA